MRRQKFRQGRPSEDAACRLSKQAMKVAVGGTSSNHNQTQSEAATVSTGVNRLTSAGRAWRVAVDMQRRAMGPKLGE